jgi:hypothetical protein
MVGSKYPRVSAARSRHSGRSPSNHTVKTVDVSCCFCCRILHNTDLLRHPDVTNSPAYTQPLIVSTVGCRCADPSQLDVICVECFSSILHMSYMVWEMELQFTNAVEMEFLSCGGDFTNVFVTKN